MKPPIATAVFISIALAAFGAFAACPQHSPKIHHVKHHPQANNCVDFNTVPQITAQIIAREPAIPKTPAYAPAAAPKYEGPTLGMTKPQPSARPAPTVGYHWNLE